MSQSKINEIASRFNKGPAGLNVGMKVLALAGAAAYGVSQSMYTGRLFIYSKFYSISSKDLRLQF